MDKDLRERTEGFDRPKIFGKVMEFQAFNDRYVLARMGILLYICREKDIFCSYVSDCAINVAGYPQETTTILIPSYLCIMPNQSVAEILHNNQIVCGLIPHRGGNYQRTWYPLRTWEEVEMWVHPFDNGDKDGKERRDERGIQILRPFCDGPAR